MTNNIAGSVTRRLAIGNEPLENEFDCTQRPAGSATALACLDEQVSIKVLHLDDAARTFTSRWTLKAPS